MGGNRVLETTSKIIENPKYVFIDQATIDNVGEKIAGEDLEIPSWDAPVFLDGDDQATIDFFLLGNSINFAYTDFDSGVKYSTGFMDTEWKGAFGMWAALKKAVQQGLPILEGEYLSRVSAEDLKTIFHGNIEIPLFDERLEIFRQVGEVLAVNYSGHFYNLVEASNGRLFNQGTGLVERLTKDFPSFDDSVVYNGEVVRFDKRAQLGPAMLYGRFGNQGQFQMGDVDELTVFADYVLPKSLRDMGILIYEESLANRIDNHQLINAGSQEELEIRASTIHASKMLQDRINQYRTDNPVNALHIDYRLWAESRNKPGPHHLTKTTAY